MALADTVNQETNISEVYADIQHKLSALQEQLLQAHPQLPTLLRTIWTQLKNDPAIVTLLSEEEANLIVQGLEKQTNTYLAESVSKPSAAKKASMKNVKIDDLF